MADKKTSLSPAKNIFKDQRVLLAIVIALIVVIISCINPNFIGINNIVAIFQQICVLGILTMAMSILLISGGIDLSIGNIMVVCGVVMYVVLDNGLPTFIAVLAGLVTGAACGLLNGAIIAKSKCIPLVITLGTSKMFYGIALTVSGGRIMNFGGALNGLKTKYFEIFSPMLLVLLAIPSVGVWSLWQYNLVSDSEKTRQKAFGIVQKQIEAAHLLGAKTILVVPGYVGCNFVEHPEKIRYDIAYERAQDALSRLVPEAKAADVTIGIENVWNRFLLSPLETRRFLDEIGSDYVGMYLDVGNAVYIGYPEQWIEILGHRIKKLHMSDYRFDQAGIGAFVDLFAGDVDFPAVAKAIAGIGYDDYITLEMLPNYKQFPEVSLYADKYAMNKIIEMIHL